MPDQLAPKLFNIHPSTEDAKAERIYTHRGIDYIFFYNVFRPLDEDWQPPSLVRVRKNRFNLEATLAKSGIEACDADMHSSLDIGGNPRLMDFYRHPDIPLPDFMRLRSEMEVRLLTEQGLPVGRTDFLEALDWDPRAMREALDYVLNAEEFSTVSDIVDSMRPTLSHKP